MVKLVRNIHFVGIGGAGMSGIAEVMLNLGYRVTGSDLRESGIIERLRAQGARIFIGHDGSNVGEAEAIVFSDAVSITNPELVEGKKRRIPVIPRSEMLAELMRFKKGIAVAGTHGKTTTTCMVGTILAEAGWDPTIIIGEILNSLGSNARLGKGEYFVAEACEAFGSFLRLFPTVVIVTSIDNDHLDYYQNMDSLQEAFVQFINRIPFYSFAMLAGDDPRIQTILSRIVKRYITYGQDPGNDLVAENIHLNGFTSNYSLRYRGQKIGSIYLPIPGYHNVLNSLAAVGTALELEVPFEIIAQALSRFTGAQRRFEIKGEVQNILVIDDYAHHPTEISATLTAARQGGKKRLIAVFQPHLYSRTRLLYKEFASSLSVADLLIITEIYPARETPLPGVTAGLIVDTIREMGKEEVYYIPRREEIAPFLHKKLRAGDMVITLGAGNIGKMADELLALLRGESISNRKEEKG